MTKLQKAKLPGEHLPLAERQLSLLGALVRTLPLWAVAPLYRVMFQAWPRASRFGNRDTPCWFCRRDNDDLQHLACRPPVREWAVHVFGPMVDHVCPPTFEGLSGLHCPSDNRCRAQRCAFVLALLEAWTWAKHGRAAPPLMGGVFRQRRRHLATRDRKVALLERAIYGRWSRHALFLRSLCVYSPGSAIPPRAILLGALALGWATSFVDGPPEGDRGLHSCFSGQNRFFAILRDLKFEFPGPK
jgi:hypothetical protein